ncbi:diguanylate cyclase with PAS/PAC and Chase2 sensors [Kalymmatonema gypsitolerans NIES-4073]|nr:diguanylate cyclase with PAS/PAC and Chase2 sensors [Scytonema sp. NIES-4073]
MGISKQLSQRLVKLLPALQQPLNQGRSEIFTASSVAICILLLRSFGFMQFLEWAALDYLFHLRPQEPPEQRITIVAIDEASLHQVGSWPIPDRYIAEVLQKLKDNQPRAIGLDIYRNLPVEPGHQDLVNAYKSIPNLVGIELLSNNKNTSVPPPPQLNQTRRVGFNNVVYDADGKVRRSLLYWHINDQAHESFALKLALMYLKSEGITPKQAKNNHESLQLGKAEFRRFQPNDGGYVGADNRGYQILSNFPKVGTGSSSVEGYGFRKVSMQDLLNNQVPPSWIKDRIVLIGSTATSLQDFVFFPYSSRLIGTVKPVAGIELQAHFISEIISAALQGRPLLKVWSHLIECLWICAWAYVGAVVTRRIQRPSLNFISIILLYFVLCGSAYVGLLFGWWIPVVPALLTFSGSTIAITYQVAYRQEELKRSKEFVHELINKIPDPIFVKNKKHQWIVLNEAYCQFIGYAENVLIEKSDYDFFPKHEADAFHACDDLVFQTQQPHENEEDFTDARGITHVIATKRSLHKDAAGNFFLVGVIRDITIRKRMEDELRRAADDLSRMNKQLKIKEDHLRYLAYHDPLTGLPNRKFFIEQLQESLLWAQENNSLTGLLFIDLDGFKQVNDNCGHEIGDRLLITIARRLTQCLRSTDTVSRLGGDEFTVILRAIPRVQVAATVAEKILVTLTEAIVLQEHIINISASIGISVYPSNSQDSETLIKLADNAMYRAKHLGKNRYEFA